MKAILAFAAVMLAGSAPSAPVDLTRVRSDLKNLLTAQESFYSDSGRYSPDISKLKLTVSDSVTLRITDFSPNAYSAVGTLAGADGVSCVMMVGRVNNPPKTAKGTVSTREGAVVCDE
jgi:hypothetical protein